MRCFKLIAHLSMRFSIEFRNLRRHEAEIYEDKSQKFIFDYITVNQVTVPKLVKTDQVDAPVARKRSNR